MENAPDAILDIARGLTTVSSTASLRPAPAHFAMQFAHICINAQHQCVTRMKNLVRNGDQSMVIGRFSIPVGSSGAGRFLHGCGRSSQRFLAANVPKRVQEVSRGRNSCLHLLPRDCDPQTHARAPLSASISLPYIYSGRVRVFSLRRGDKT